MEDIESITVHPFGDGLLVEMLGIDDHAGITTETIELDIINDDKVKSREKMPSEYEERIREALSENGYSLVGQ